MLREKIPLWRNLHVIQSFEIFLVNGEDLIILVRELVGLPPNTAIPLG